MIRRRSLLALTGLGGAAALLPAGPALAAPPRTIDLPAPTAGRPVGTTVLHLVDHDRPDPFAPAPGPRELMVQLWYPAHTTAGRPRAPYTTPRVAAVIERVLPLDPGTLTLVRPTARAGAPATPGPLPLLLLGHGRGGGRGNCTALAEELAAHGYLVAAVDHTYDAAAVEFPDGRLVLGALPDDPPDWDAQDHKEIAARVGDLRFVIDELTGGRLPFRVDRERIGALGHSMGGAAAAEAMRRDRRLRIGLDLDGGLFGSPVPDPGLDRPFLLLTSLDDHDTWRRWREHHRAWGRQLRAGGAGHLSFTDLPHAAGPGNVAAHLPADLYATLFGTLTPARATALTRAYVLAFVDRFLRDRPAPLLDGPSPRYPEIGFRWAHG
ncbi:alpha/beta hydrolase [Kitasatospora sp. NPDC056783]|uniref:alpha/beta hydrolase n=1 Tax=Kitasatospora sp. NPDC056783 TaxID=3345943 RepID=UPI0036AB789A